MELQTINKLYLELSQFATAKTRKEIALEDKLELCRVFLAECKGDTLDRISPGLKRQAEVLFANVFYDEVIAQTNDADKPRQNSPTEPAAAPQA